MLGGWQGALSGLNFAGILLCVLGGAMVSGSFKRQEVDSMVYSRLGEATPRVALPLAPMLTALFAGGFCFLLAWVGTLLR